MMFDRAETEVLPSTSKVGGEEAVVVVKRLRSWMAQARARASSTERGSNEKCGTSTGLFNS